MSIILKGIDLPPNAKVELIVKSPTESFRKQIPKSKVIQIPKGHGRLIDADELKEKRETMCWKDEYYMTHESDFIDSRHIDNAPTILEAEEIK